MVTTKIEQEIIQLLSSQHYLIYIINNEEDRLEYILNQLSQKIYQNYLYTWDFINGYNNKAQSAKKNPLEALNFIENMDHYNSKIFLLKDFDKFINDISINRKLKNLSKSLRQNKKYLIFSCNNNNIQLDIKEYITFLELPLPNQKEILNELQRLLKIFDITNNIPLSNLALIYQGFSINQIRKSMSKMSFHNTINEKTLQYILEDKKQIIQETNILEFYPRKNNLSNIGGLNNLKSWLKKRKETFSNTARQYGIKPPKGILLVGIQGTGKSISAQSISLEWNIPLLRLDIGKIFGGIIGESESRTRQMIQIAEQVAPCVLWIDEIDKVFTKNNTNNDSGTTNRVISTLLTWLAEKDNGVFIVTTANNIMNLPIELLRKGRFDEIFFLDLPNFEERLHILQIHLKKLRPGSWNKYNIYYLSKISEKFSGAEIEYAITDAMNNAFYENREFTTQDIEQTIKQLIPISIIDEKNISDLQELALSGRIKIA